jgi:hypothetical protein
MCSMNSLIWETSSNQSLDTSGHGLYIYLFFLNLCGRHVIVKVVTVYQNTDEFDYAMPTKN